MLDSVLRSAGYKTGLFTSPYIRFFNERICFDGKPISNDELAEVTAYVKPIADKMTEKPTEFELISAIGFEYFKRKKCDVVILEAGMGGRLDSTNIIESPLLSVITGIAFDHTAFLGDTIEKIAAEKAGIIKKDRPVLWGGNSELALEVIKAQADKMNAHFHATGRDTIKVTNSTLEGTLFDYAERKDITISLLGSYQPYNAASVLEAVDILRSLGVAVSENAVRKGIADTAWRARFEIVSHDPLVIFDGAHNPDGIAAATESIARYFPDGRVYILSGVLRDKDYGEIAKTLSTVALRAFTVRPPSPRALDEKEYARVLSSAGIPTEAFADARAAFLYAKSEAKKNGVPLICLGSLYTYAALYPCF
jgi:dihydrofolate synthase/folylpolyglutamate synthase